MKKLNKVEVFFKFTLPCFFKHVDYLLAVHRAHLRARMRVIRSAWAASFKDEDEEDDEYWEE